MHCQPFRREAAQPINDTAHSQICGSPCPVSIFKGGSTVPVKFQLKDANGNVVQTTSLPLWLTPVKGSPCAGYIAHPSESQPKLVVGQSPATT
jgi:hypothetical protein